MCTYQQRMYTCSKPYPSNRSRRPCWTGIDSARLDAAAVGVKRNGLRLRDDPDVGSAACTGGPAGVQAVLAHGFVRPPKWMRLAQPQREVAEPVPGHVQGLEAYGPLGS
jgi:hypothetical protein